MKIEHVKSKYPQLRREANLLKHFEGAVGFPKIHYSGAEGDFNFIVMDQLGPSLEGLFKLYERKFSLKTVLMLADQMLSRVEYLHSKGFVHRDIKPDNFLMERGEQSTVVYLIDFGLVSMYRKPETGQHIAYKNNQNFKGNARFASINSHLGIQQSRRDDLEAIGYVLMYFNRGELPWQRMKGTWEEKYHQIMEKKRSTSAESLCSGFPVEFAAYLNYCRALQFEQVPDYAHLRNLFQGLFVDRSFKNDGLFDWKDTNDRESLDRESLSKTSTSVPTDPVETHRNEQTEIADCHKDIPIEYISCAEPSPAEQLQQKGGVTFRACGKRTMTKNLRVILHM